jgi:hypothetical protein
MTDSGEHASVNSSALGRLLAEVSWEGSTVRKYRQGGRGHENVLTAEVLMPLDFLPRAAFLGAVVQAAHGADDARALLLREIEDAEITLLPGEVNRAPRVQPDGLIMSPGCRVLVEAKRMRRSSFQQEQLAREYVALMRDAGGRTSLLFLVLGTPLPVAVAGQGRLAVEESVMRHIDEVYDRSRLCEPSLDVMVERLPDAWAWITWREIGDAVSTALAGFDASNDSVAGTMRRLAGWVTRAVAWHG